MTSTPPNFGVDKNCPINVTRDSDVEVPPDGEAPLPCGNNLGKHSGRFRLNLCLILTKGVLLLRKLSVRPPLRASQLCPSDRIYLNGTSLH